MIVAAKGDSNLNNRADLHQNHRDRSLNLVVGAIAANYLNLLGFTALAYVWAFQAKHILKGGADTPLERTKLKTARYNMEREMPEHQFLVPLIESGKSNMFDFEVDEL